MVVMVIVMPDILTILNVNRVTNRDLAKRTANPKLIKSAWSWKKDKL